MKGKVYIPDDFRVFNEKEDDIFLWDQYSEIKEDVKEAIYMKPLFSHLFIDEGIYCTVWWNDELGYWCGSIYVNYDYVDTYICESLEELSEEFLKEYSEV
jgi:hypothetical protein